MATPIRALLFDKDGTLFGFRKTWLAAYRSAASEPAEVAGLGPWFVDALLSRHGYDPASHTFAAESPLLWDDAGSSGAVERRAGTGRDQRCRTASRAAFSDLDASAGVGR